MSAGSADAGAPSTPGEATDARARRDGRTEDGTHRRVAITGIGPITAVGVGADAFFRGLQEQCSPIRRITRFDSSPWRSRIAAEIDDFEPALHMDARLARRLDRYGQFALSAARLALDDARLDESTLDGERVAVQMGSALGGVAYAEEQVLNLMRDGIRAVDPRVALTTFGGAASCIIAIECGFSGPNSTNSMSCASGTLAIGEAFRLIRDGAADAAIAGAAEAPLSSLSFGAFALIRAMSTRNDDPTRACRPFDRDRDGFVMGEGACAVVLERMDRALERGARVYGEILGYGTTNDAHHMTAPRPDGSQAARAMRLALEQARVRPEQVDYISAHGSSTPLNDPTESAAVHHVFGDAATRVPVSSTKPYHAHALGASGAIEFAACALAMERGWIPPTLNFDEPDPACDLDYVPNQGRSLQPDVCLSNSFGFGGINGSLVLARTGRKGNGRRQA